MPDRERACRRRCSVAARAEPLKDSELFRTLWIGALNLVSVLVIYVVWPYWLFRSKVRGDPSYHG